MFKDREAYNNSSSLVEPPAGLFERILLAIKREQELRKTKRVAFGFLALLTVSLLTAPFSWSFFIEEMQESGFFTLLDTAIQNTGVFFSVWSDFSMALAEALPLTSIAIVTINMILAVFTARLFLYNKRALIGYILYTN